MRWKIVITHFRRKQKLRENDRLPIAITVCLLRNFEKSNKNMYSTYTQCENYGNLLSHFFPKFRESNVITKEIAKELIWRFFLFFLWERISCFFLNQCDIVKTTKISWNQLSTNWLWLRSVEKSSKIRSMF